MKGDKAEKKAAKAEKKAAKQEAAAKKKAEKKAANAKKKAAKMEKKAKNRIAKQEEKAEKLAQEADQEPGKGGGKKKKLLLLIPIVLALLAALAYFVIIPRFFSKEKEPEPEPEPEPITAPVTYQMGQTAVPALPAWGADVLVYLEDPPEPPAPESEEDGEAGKDEDGKPEDGKSEKDSQPEEKDGEDGEADQEDGEAEGEEEKQAEEPAEPPVITAVRYRYEGYTDYRELLMGYAAFMTTPDVGFSFVDDTLVRLKEEQHPIMTTHRGVVTLARNAVDEADAGKAMTIQLEWTDTNCFVTVDTPEGRVKDPPPPPTANAAASMTLMEAMDFVNSLDPADLGLSGSSMEEYTIYAMDGAVMIDNIPCMHLNVYDDNATGTNVVAGQYFMSSDGQHIYLLHPDTNTVEELDVLP